MNACLFFSRRLIIGALVSLLAGCGGGLATHSDVNQDLGDPPDAVPKVEPKSKYGNMSSYEVLGRQYKTKRSSRNFVQRGLASWYGSKFHGRRTSSGEVYDMHQMTAAHKTLPLPSYVRVTNLENGRSIVVRVNDRGPFHRGRIIDLSYAAARKLNIVATGTAKVEVRSIDPRDHGGIVEAPPAAPLEHHERQPNAFFDETFSQNDQLYLQVGAFGELANAEQLRHRLLAHVPGSVNIRPGAEAESAPYKVQVGPLSSRAEAEAVSQRLTHLGLAQGVVIGR
ncbi:septal ring lytic transglycosylase RlpA family protein [Rhabdochromatium marinum]|uniref:septal ring lytic transglycosylase RlpA family protein n=1 Tax=Rhabdochromatium marinum TaxID=48729 RepID=UPI0019041573|nr:septal ring lytic transglycosylase RlpA family protein [Rhabdochromatium marinum]MBK1647161.1 septal ring lytic transglycosylase RlpA family lipoprotein [Rhabdochromatium marinum]